MKLETAIALAYEGVRISHDYFTESENVSMRHGKLYFEDFVEVDLREFAQGRPWASQGWRVFNKEDLEKLFTNP